MPEPSSRNMESADGPRFSPIPKRPIESYPLSDERRWLLGVVESARTNGSRPELIYQILSLLKQRALSLRGAQVLAYAVHVTAARRRDLDQPLGALLNLTARNLFKILNGVETQPVQSQGAISRLETKLLLGPRGGNIDASFRELQLRTLEEKLFSSFMRQPLLDAPASRILTDLVEALPKIEKPTLRPLEILVLSTLASRKEAGTFKTYAALADELGIAERTLHEILRGNRNGPSAAEKLIDFVNRTTPAFSSTIRNALDSLLTKKAALSIDVELLRRVIGRSNDVPRHALTADERGVLLEVIRMRSEGAFRNLTELAQELGRSVWAVQRILSPQFAGSAVARLDHFLVVESSPFRDLLIREARSAIPFHPLDLLATCRPDMALAQKLRTLVMDELKGVELPGCTISQRDRQGWVSRELTATERELVVTSYLSGRFQGAADMARRCDEVLAMRSKLKARQDTIHRFLYGRVEAGGERLGAIHILMEHLSSAPGESETRDEAMWRRAVAVAEQPAMEVVQLCSCIALERPNTVGEIAAYATKVAAGQPRLAAFFQQMGSDEKGVLKIDQPAAAERLRDCYDLAYRDDEPLGFAKPLLRSMQQLGVPRRAVSALLTNLAGIPKWAHGSSCIQAFADVARGESDRSLPWLRGYADHGWRGFVMSSFPEAFAAGVLETVRYSFIDLVALRQKKSAEYERVQQLVQHFFAKWRIGTIINRYFRNVLVGPKNANGLPWDELEAILVHSVHDAAVLYHPEERIQQGLPVLTFAGAAFQRMRWDVSSALSPRVRDVLRKAESLDEGRGGGGESYSLKDMLPADVDDDTSELADFEDLEAVRNALKQLSPVHTRVLSLWFGSGNEPHTLKAIAETLHSEELRDKVVSHTMVQLLIGEALAALRQQLCRGTSSEWEYYLKEPFSHEDPPPRGVPMGEGVLTVCPSLSIRGLPFEMGTMVMVRMQRVFREATGAAELLLHVQEFKSRQKAFQVIIVVDNEGITSTEVVTE